MQQKQYKGGIIKNHASRIVCFFLPLTQLMPTLVDYPAHINFPKQ